MAYLNVRERRIEAKIAYVGPALAGKATNFAHLRRSAPEARLGKIVDSASDESDVLSFAWQPADTSSFRDCDVRVKVVAPRGDVTGDRVQNILRDADGVVVVMDARRGAVDVNRSALASVREALARAERRAVPVVVQVNKSDLPDALPAADIAGAVGAAELRHVSAAAVRGEGVIETLEAALAEVLAAMSRGDDPGESSGPVTARPSRPPAPEMSHPLLAALRDVLRATVREQADELAARVTAHVDASLEKLRARVDELETSAVALRKAVEDADDRRADEHRLVVAAFEATGHVVRMTSRETLEKLDVSELREDMKGDLVRTLEARSRADREYLANATGNVRKAVDAVANDVRQQDARPRLGEVVDLVSAIAEGTAQLATHVGAASGGVRDLKSVSARINERIDALEARFNELIEELKKPKKGWFS